LEFVAESCTTSASTGLGFFVKTGSRDENQEILGVSHFLEHMMFKGTARRTAEDINREFDEIGASYNASTGHENTCYWANFMPEHISRVVDLLSDMMHPAFRNDDFEMEKKVILEEIEMYEDTPSVLAVDLCEQSYFADHPLGNRVLGTRETIGNLSREQMQDYYRRRYNPRNIVVVASGQFDWEALSDILERSCGDWSGPPLQRETPPHSGRELKEAHAKSQVIREHIALLCPAPPAAHPDFRAAGLVSSMIGDNTGSRFYWSLVHPAVADVASLHYWPRIGVGSFSGYFSCAPEHTGKVLEIVKEELDQIRNSGFTGEELERAQNKDGTEFALSTEVPMGRMQSLASDWIYRGRYASIEEEIEELRAVTLDDVNRVLGEFPFRPIGVVGYGPVEKI
jgi:predicted Zn-dependent peptidase